MLVSGVLIGTLINAKEINLQIFEGWVQTIQTKYLKHVPLGYYICEALIAVPSGAILL